MEELRAFGTEEASPAHGTGQEMEGTSSDSDVQHSAGSSSRESSKGFLAHKPKPGPLWGLGTALMALALVFREKDRGK